MKIIRALGMGLVPLSKRLREFLHLFLLIRTQQKRRASMNQERFSPNLSVPRSWTYPLLNHEIEISVVYRPPPTQAMVLYHSSLS